MADERPEQQGKFRERVEDDAGGLIRKEEHRRRPSTGGLAFEQLADPAAASMGFIPISNIIILDGSLESENDADLRLDLGVSLLLEQLQNDKCCQLQKPTQNRISSGNSKTSFEPGSRKYVSLAIHLGTTESCIAHMTPQGPKVIQAEQQGQLLPSAVYYDRSGNLLVGSRAREAMTLSKAADGQGFTGFILQLGSDAQYKFTAAGKTLSATELCAIIIQTLLRAYQRESGEEAQACVITIPAKFRQDAVEGIRMAAELAGLRYCPLIMEPVAAAMCYGFNAQQHRARILVFDLGRGTLDVSLVISRQGKLIVPDGGHAGDDNLGGRYFDEQLAGYVLTQLEERYKLTKFRTDRGKFSNEWGRFLLAVKAAKIQLSARAESLVELETPLCLDDQGIEVEVKVPVTRKAYEDLIRPLAERAVQICETLLKSNRLSADDVERMILLGGPSKTPLIQGMLRERLGIPLESSIDPMTAIVEGAAIYADTVEIPGSDNDSKPPSAGSYRVKIDCERQSQLPTYQAIGIVDGPETEGLRVEVERMDGCWKSPSIPVDETGVFTVELLLSQGPKPVLSEFRTDLLDRFGRLLASVLEPAIWFPSLGRENRRTNSQGKVSEIEE
jgi:molecular chaperone DnaK